MAIFKKKEGGTKVGNTLRSIGSVFKAPANYTPPKVQINKTSVPTINAPKAPNISNAVNAVKSSVSTVKAPTISTASMTKTPTKSSSNSSSSSFPVGGMSISPTKTIQASDPNAPKFSPVGGIGSQSGGYTYTKNGWQKNTIPGGSGGSGSSSSIDTFGSGGESSSDFSMDTYEEPTASAKMATGDVFAGSDYGDIGKLYSDYMSGGDIVDTSSIRSRAIADVQDRINALNQVYDQQLSRVQQEGVGRTGETTALLAARGLAGSMRGGAIADLTRTQNRQLEDQVYAQRNSAIQSILADANKAAMQEIQSKTEARLGGASALISFLKGADERKQNYVNSVAQNLIASGVDLESMTPQQVQQLTQAAQKAGVSFNNIVAAYNMVKASQGAEDAFSLSSGQARYDAQGNLIAQNAGGAGEVSAEVLALAKQVNDGVITLQQVPSALRGAVSLAQSSLPNPRINELDAVIATIDELAANPRLKAILGPIDQARGSLLLGSKANVSKNLYDQLTGILALEGRSKLKGSGAISDFEFRVLKDAQSALGRNLNEEEFKKQLAKVRDVLENRKQTLSSGTTQTGTVSGEGTFAEQW